MSQGSRQAWITIGVFLFIAFMGYAWWSQLPITHGPGQIAPDVPFQERVDQAESFNFKDYEIVPLAYFDVEARVLSRERYYRDRESDLSPIDLALGWGPMSDEEVLKGIKISQSGRFYFWRVKQWPIPRDQIENNSANMHMIPADGSVEDRMKEVREGHLVRFSGYLVRIAGDDGWRWKSSLTRHDTGANACEVVYVEDFEIIENGVQ